MKKMMWAVYTTKASKMPRFICERYWDAKDYCRVWHESSNMKNYGVIERIMVEKNELTGAYTLYHHEYTKI